MKRFLSTTAVALTLAGAAFAGGNDKPLTTVEVTQSDFFASDLIGMRIYNSETQLSADTRITDGAEREWDDIGEINDIIIGQNGEVRAVILGVGGFLGMGERDVSVSMDDIQVLREEGDSNDRFLVVSTSKEALENAPVFDRELQKQAEHAASEVKTEAEHAAQNANKALDEAENDLSQTADNVTQTAEDVANSAEAKAEHLAAKAEASMETTDLKRPEVEREGYEPMDLKLANLDGLTAEKLQGAAVMGENDETVGEVDKLIMTENGQVSEVVINVGGFLGLGEKPVAVPFERLQILRGVEEGDVRIYIDANEAALEAKPEYRG